MDVQHFDVRAIVYLIGIYHGRLCGEQCLVDSWTKKVCTNRTKLVGINKFSVRGSETLLNLR